MSKHVAVNVRLDWRTMEQIDQVLRQLEERPDPILLAPSRSSVIRLALHTGLTQLLGGAA